MTDPLQNPDYPETAYYTDGVGVAEMPNLPRYKQTFQSLGWWEITHEEYKRRYAELEVSQPFRIAKYTAK